MRDAIPPTTRKEIRSFLGIASYYRRFIPGFGTITRPLNEKTSDNVKIIWSADMQIAFEELKVKLTSAPVLAYPNYKNHSWYAPMPQVKQLVLSYPKLTRTVVIILYITRAGLYLQQNRIILHLKKKLWASFLH